MRSHGGAIGLGVVAPPSWPSRQVAPSATKCACSTNVRSRVHSPGEANGRWVARRPHEGKQPRLHHQATQNSWPALLVGGLLARKRLPIPATTKGESRKIPIINRVVGADLVSACGCGACGTRTTRQGGDRRPLHGDGAHLVGGPDTQHRRLKLLHVRLGQWWSVPSFKLRRRAWKRGTSTPSQVSPTLMAKLCR